MVQNTQEVWSIELGAGVGPFRLGSSFAHVFHALKERTPVRPFEINYSGPEPYKYPVIIHCPEDGLNLKFDPVRQVLKSIEFYAVNLVPLRYGRVILFGGDFAATFMSVYNLFGPTFPGHYESSTKTYYLSYEGACIEFPIPSEYENLYQNKNELPLEFPNGYTPAATGLMVFAGSNWKSPEIPAPLHKHFGEVVEVEVSDNLITVQFTSRKKRLEIGWTPQEIMSAIGQPVSVYRKSDDPNHGPNGSSHFVGEYFHNYPHLGIDIMYDSLHRVSKIILKTNAVGHPEFTVYNKCNFHLSFTRPAWKKAQISPETPWKDIQKMLLVEDLRPVIHDSGLGLHPFGSSLCYSPVPGVVFEVMKNGFIAGVTLTSEK